MSRLRQYLAVAITLILLWSQLPPPVRGQNSDTTLRLTPPTIEVAPGQTVDVAVNVENVTALYGFDITVAYDPTIIEVVDLDPNLDGIQLALGLFLDPGFVIFNQADNSLGQLRLVMTQLDPSEPKTGDGALMVIRFQALQAGKSPILLLAGQLAQRNGDTFFPQLVGGQLSVTALGQPIVFTPIPSQNAGTPLPTTTPALLPTTTKEPAAATATPTNQPATAAPTATPPGELSATPVAPTATVPATAETVAESSPPATESTPTSNPPAATQVASVITADDTALVSDLTEADNNPAVIMESEPTAVSENDTAGVTIIGSNSLAENSDTDEVTSPDANNQPGSWVAGASLGGGLLLVIVILFFFLSRKQTAGPS